MRLKTLNRTDWSILAVGTLAIVGVVWWAICWYYKSPENGAQFTPGELGSAINIPIGIATIVLVYFAWRTYDVANSQLRAMENDQKRQLLERTLSAAIGDYVQRIRADEERKKMTTGEGGSFKSAYRKCKEYTPVETHRAGNDRYGDFRTANYILKPLMYWCSWITASGMGNDPDLKAELVACAHRMLAAMESPCQVYIIMAEQMKLHELETTAQGYLRQIAAHHLIYEFVDGNAHAELEDCKNSNPGQFKNIDECLMRVKWHEDAAVRQRFFA